MRKILALAVVTTFAVAIVLSAAAASSTTLTVTPSSSQGWVVYGDPGASVTFVDGPATPPLGSGSIRLQIPADGNAFTNIRQPGYAGTLLSSLTALDYYTYVNHFVDGQAPYLLLNIDTDNDGVADDFLFFEPVYQ